jgi:hypothetical protein
VDLQLGAWEWDNWDFEGPACCCAYVAECVIGRARKGGRLAARAGRRARKSERFQIWRIWRTKREKDRNKETTRGGSAIH